MQEKSDRSKFDWRFAALWIAILLSLGAAAIAIRNYSMPGATNASQQSDREELARLREELSKEPNSRFLHNQLAVILLRMRDYRSAKHELEASRDIDPTNPITHAQLAFVSKLLSDYDGELKSLRSAVELDPQNPAIRYNLCDALERQSALDEAIEQCEVALRVAPSATKEYFDPRGNFYSIQKVRENAREKLEELAKRKSTQPAAKKP